MRNWSKQQSRLTWPKFDARLRRDQRGIGTGRFPRRSKRASQQGTWPSHCNGRSDPMESYLAVVWGLLLGLAIVMYVILDGHRYLVPDNTDRSRARWPRERSTRSRQARSSSGGRRETAFLFSARNA